MSGEELFGCLLMVSAIITFAGYTGTGIRDAVLQGRYAEWQPEVLVIMLPLGAYSVGLVMAKSAGLPLIDASPEIASLFYGVLGLLLGALIALGAAIIFATLLLNQHRRHLG